MEHRLDNIWMDVQGCELSTANAHQQIQQLEDEVVVPFIEKVTLMYWDCFMSGGAMESEFRGTLENHQERLNEVELTSGIAKEKCNSVQDVLTSWMSTFKALEGSIRDTTTRVIAMEDHLTERSQSLVDLDSQVQANSDIIKLLVERMSSQEATITALRDWVGELELGRCLLHDRIIAIEVGQ